MRGAIDAPVKLLIYSDFQCPYCARLANEVLPKIEDRYLTKGQVAFVFRHLPLEAMHPDARSAALAAECAGAQGHFWEMHDKLFQSGNQLGPGNLLSYSSTLKLDQQRFQSCLSEPSENLASDLNEAESLGLSGTPVLFLGVAAPGRTIDIKKKLAGLQSVETLDRNITELLKLSAK